MECSTKSGVDVGCTACGPRQTIDAAIEAARRAGERHYQEREALRLDVEHARYDAQLAGRRCERVDPDLRLVAAELEARWNAALERVHDLEGRLTAFDARTVTQQQIDEHAVDWASNPRTRDPIFRLSLIVGAGAGRIASMR
ncbi:MAG: hypothetical protein ABJA98_00030 [Acidobacteriota bacterium]